MAGRYWCPNKCGNGPWGTAGNRDKHVERRCPGVPTTDGVVDRAQTTTVPTDRAQNLGTEEIFNGNTPLSAAQLPGHRGHNLSSPPSVSEGEGAQRAQTTVPIVSTPGPGGPVDDPRSREREAVTFLSAHKAYLKPEFEMGFYLSMKYKVLGNGEAPRPLTERERDILFELEYVVRGLVAEDDAQAENDRRAAHDPKDGHPKENCRYCEQEAENARLAALSYDRDLDAMRVRYNTLNGKNLSWDEWNAFLDAPSEPVRPVETRSEVTRRRDLARSPRPILRPKAAPTAQADRAPRDDNA